MNRRGTERLQTAAMLGRGIAFVSFEIVTRMQRIELSHDRVARSLCDDRCGSDAGRQRVAFDDAALRVSAMWNAASVHENEVRLRSQAFDRASHREQASMINIERVDFFNFRAANRPDDGVLLDLFSKFTADRFIQNL